VDIRKRGLFEDGENSATWRYKISAVIQILLGLLRTGEVILLLADDTPHSLCFMT
jgi:hypothetical protein